MQSDVRQRHVRPGNELGVDNLLQRTTFAEPLQQRGQLVGLPIVWKVHPVDVPESLPAPLQEKSSSPGTVQHTRKDPPLRRIRPKMARLERVTRGFSGDPLVHPSLLSLPVRVHVCIKTLQSAHRKEEEAKAQR